MALAARVGSAYVLVRPSLKGFQADAGREAKRAGAAAGTQAGGVMGRNMARGAAAGMTADIPRLKRAAATAAAAVQTEAARYAAARQAQTSATSRLAIAEQRLVELRAKGNATQSAMMAAEARVATAKAGVARATDTASAAQARYVAAMKTSTAAQATLTAAMKTSATSAAAHGASAGRRFMSSMIGGIRAGAAKVTGAVRTSLAGASAAATGAGRTAGRGFMGGMMAGLGPLAAMLAPVAILGSGFKRLANIEDARAQLENLGHTGEKLESIMTNALSSVEGTAYGLDEAAGLAGQAVAGGIEPGEDLERQLKLVANAAAQSKTDMGEMGSIFQKVWTSNRAQTQELNQLADRGIPIWTKLAEHYGVSQEELRKMVSAGKVDLETFSVVLEDTVGDAALAMGDTTRGVFRNVGAAASRLGAAILTEMFPLFKAAGRGMISVMGELTASIQDVVAWGKENASWLGPLAMGLGIATGGFWALRAAIWAVNMVMRVNPMFLLVAAIGTLIGGLIYAYRHFEGFRRVVDSVWTEITGGIRAFRAAWSAFDGDITSAGFPGFMERLAYVARWVWTEVTGGIRAFAASWRAFDGDVTSAGFPGFMERIAYIARWVWTEVTGGIRAFAAAWLYNDGEITSSGFPGFMERAGFIARQAFGLMVTSGRAVATFVTGTLVPALASFWTNTAQPVLSGLGNLAVLVWRDLIQPALAGLWSALQWVGTQLLWLWSTVARPVFTLIGQAVATMWRDIVAPTLQALWTFISKVLGPVIFWLLRNVVGPVFVGVGKAIADFWNGTAQPVLKAAVWFFENVLAPVVRWLYDNIFKPYFDSIGAIVKSVWENARPVLDSFKSGLSDLGDRFTRVRDGISRAWDSLARLVATPIRATIEWVNTNFLGRLESTLNDIPGVSGVSIPRIKVPSLPGTVLTAAQQTYGRSYGPGLGGLADGGVLPGWSPGTDDMHFFSPVHGWLHLAGGEPVMRPEFGAVVGREWIDSMNLAARTGGVTGVRRALGVDQAHAGGGVIGRAAGPAGRIMDHVSSVASAGWDWITDFMSDASGWVKSKFANMLGGIGESWPAQAVSGAAGTVVSKVADWIRSQLFGGEDEGAPAGGGRVGPSMGWRSIWGLVKGLFPDAILTSAVRNSRTAGYGTRSLHADGRALDFVLNPWSRMVGATALLSKLRGWTELIHTPAGRWQQSFGRSFTNFLPITKAQHHNHVHVGVSGGGTIPQARDYNALAAKMMARGPLVRDQGGPIPPGDWWVRNDTGKTEWVMDPRGGGRGPQLPAGPQRIVGELELRGGKAYIRGVIEESPREVAVAGAAGKSQFGSRVRPGGGAP